MACNWCDPSGPLTGKRCRECQRIYNLHLAAEEGDDSEATQWIWEHAETLRSPRRDDIYERRQHRWLAARFTRRPIMPDDVCDCGVSFIYHPGLVRTCERNREAREALRLLLSASEAAVAGLTNEFGYSSVKANWQPLLDAIDTAKICLAK